MNDRKFRGLTLLIIIVFTIINVSIMISIDKVVANMWPIYERIGVDGWVSPATTIISQILLGVGSATVLFGSLLVFSKERLGKLLMVIGAVLTLTTTGLFVLLILLFFRKYFDWAR